MKHPSSREFFAYWDEKRGTARAPDRSEIEPGAVRELLGDIFVLSADADTGYPFRVAGTRVSALLGCDLKDRSFSALFMPDCRREIEEVVGRHHRDSPGWRTGASGIAAAAVQRPRACTDQPDRIARTVRKRTQPAAGLPADIMALSASAPASGSARVAQTGDCARLHGL